MKLVQLNIERAKHLDRFLPAVAAFEPDVVCLQEVIDSTVPRIERELGMRASYAPMCGLSGYEAECEGQAFGVAILTREPHTLKGMHYYRGSADTLVTYHGAGPVETRDTNIYKVLLVADVHVGDESLTVGCTHFTWSAGGMTSETQRKDYVALERFLDAYPELILCGDFNIPRGTELYKHLAVRYSDNIPNEVECTLDPLLHRAGRLALVVDYVFTTPGYQAQNVRVLPGFSDHCAVVADVSARS